MDDHYDLDTTLEYGGDATGAKWRRMTKTLRRVVGELMQKVMYSGSLTTSDWRIADDKTIGAGEGIVDECYCETTSTTDISSLLTSNATNYIYLITDADSATDGTIVAQASLLASAPSYACCLGSITLDASGNVTAVDNDDEDFPRDYALPLRWRRVQFEVVETIPQGTYADVEIDHSGDIEFVHGFCPKISSIDTGCRAVLQLNGTTNAKFTMRVYNDGTWAYGYGYAVPYEYGYGYAYGYGTLEEVRIIGERWGI